jgi:hypothetical protein
VGETIGACEEGLAICRGLGDRQGEGRSLMRLGRLHDRQGHQEEAHRFWREALTRLHPDSPEYRQVSSWLSDPA